MSDPVVVPEGYPEFLARLKDQVATTRQHATRVVNTELITLYWDLGAAILDRQDIQGWGATVVDRLVTDLQAAFPDMRGFSRSNLYAWTSLRSSPWAGPRPDHDAGPRRASPSSLPN